MPIGMSHDWRGSTSSDLILISLRDQSKLKRCAFSLFPVVGSKNPKVTNLSHPEPTNRTLGAILFGHIRYSLRISVVAQALRDSPCRVDCD